MNHVYVRRIVSSFSDIIYGQSLVSLISDIYVSIVSRDINQ